MAQDQWHGRRVYHRRADLFGVVDGVIFDEGASEPKAAYVKYEWPYDQEAATVYVPIAELRQVS